MSFLVKTIVFYFYIVIPYEVRQFFWLILFVGEKFLIYSNREKTFVLPF